METKHTQGEWKVVFPPNAPNGVLVMTEKGCITVEPTTEEGIANAKLIAASPLMFNYIKEKADNGCVDAKKLLTNAKLIEYNY